MVFCIYPYNLYTFNFYTSIFNWRIGDKNVFLEKCIMLYKYILFFIHKILRLYNKVSMFLFKLYFSPYFYRTYKGDIVVYEKIKYDSLISTHTKQLIVTYECDKLYNCYNRIIYNPSNYLLTHIHNYTNYIFMNITLVIENYPQFTLYLRTPQYNFYICDNVINSDFILFYLYNILKVIPKNLYYINNLTYKLMILDHSFKKYNLTEDDTIVLCKNTFTITDKNNKE